MKGWGKGKKEKMSREEYFRVFIALSGKYNPNYVSYVVWL
jgi:hypothetical protein